MQIKVIIGNAELTFEGKDYQEAAKYAAAFTQVKKCSLCGGMDFGLDYRSIQDYEYNSIKCLDCDAQATFGLYKTGGFFLKKWDKYEHPQPTDQPKKEPF